MPSLLAFFKFQNAQLEPRFSSRLLGVIYALLLVCMTIYLVTVFVKGVPLNLKIIPAAALLFVVGFVPLPFSWRMLGLIASVSLLTLVVMAAHDVPDVLHSIRLIELEQSLFGGALANVVLQRALFNPEQYSLLDYLTTADYVLTNLLPFAGILYLYWRAPHMLPRYMLAVVLIFTLATFTYLMLPAAPPWILSSQGLIPPLHRIGPMLLGDLNLPWIRSAFSTLADHPVAALPSMHVGYTTLVMAFFAMTHPKHGIWLALLIAIGTIFSVLYLGEHFAIDVVLGMLYAWLATSLSGYLYRLVESPNPS